MSLEAGRIRVEISGRQYEWEGGFGAILKSRESGVKQGEVRMIAGSTLFAYHVYQPRWWRTPEVWWSRNEIDAEWIRSFKAHILGCKP
jgi:hypothetical protein